MTTLDYFVLGLTGLSLVFGLLKGLVRSALALGMTVVGLFLAVSGYSKAAPLVRSFVETDLTAQLIGFLSIFVGVVLVGMSIGRLIRKGLEKAHLSWIDHLAGGAFGLVRGWLICSIIYLAMTAFPVQLEMLAEARLTPYLIRGAELLTHVITNNLKESFINGYQQLRTLENESS